MNRKSKRFTLSNISQFVQKACDLANNNEFFVRLDNHKISYPHGAFPNMIAFGSISSISLAESSSAFNQFKEYIQKTQDWVFGYFSYDLKNDTENLYSRNADHKSFPELLFFCPQNILEFHEDEVIIHSLGDPEKLFNEILNHSPLDEVLENETIEFKTETSREEYLEVINKLRRHIYEGDVYEINYCMEYLAHSENINSYNYWLKLCEQSPTPFAAFLKASQFSLICASPERFIKKNKSKIISQPIKGTIHTGKGKLERKENKEQLFNSEKERAENMMIVDLVRNDLAKSSKPGSVKVEELFGIYEFRHLFHMISTVVSEAKDTVELVDIIKNAFPMGSMTGAPKIKVMELIEDYEKSKRGIFSGSIGYIDPSGNFDFNVIIRSLFYNSGTKLLSYNIGSAITYDSDPEQEYEECQLKAKAIREIFQK
ncbi:MAG: anthranilate synthase component I family protein [Cytophagales bacterium]